MTNAEVKGNSKYEDESWDKKAARACGRFMEITFSKTSFDKKKNIYTY
jgi:hypothetical protein